MFYCAKRFLRSRVPPNWCFRPSVVCTDNNWFLPLVYEPRTRARGYWDFENMILRAPEKRCHKVKLRLKVGTLGDRFLNTFGRSFLKNVAKTCRSRLSCQRPGNDHQMTGRHCDVPANVSWSCLMKWTVSAIRASLPCSRSAGSSAFTTGFPYGKDFAGGLALW